VSEKSSESLRLVRAFLALPVPVTLQDSQFRLLQANAAYAALLNQPVQQLLGRDPLALEPAEDREGHLAHRADNQLNFERGLPLLPSQHRLLDASGRMRWFSAQAVPLTEAASPGRVEWLVQWHEITSEVLAREQARGAQDELAQWFELSGNGMLVYDASGLIVRCNAALEALIERVPEVLDEASPEMQVLLGWQPSAGSPQSGTMMQALAPGAPPIEIQAMVPVADGRRRRLSARLTCSVSAQGTRRVMAVVQDRSTEDERDLAQLEMGMLMDTASIGVATYDPMRGWLAPQASGGGAGVAAGAKPTGAGGKASGALLGIGRELVEPASLPEYEKLQRALRSGERTEVRYAVRHPELGARWLLTRVEPGALSGGRPTTSVVTLDVTDQERAQRRNEELLRELSIILDSSTAGIAYLRGPVLVRCNQRFERMLGFPPGGAAGASLEEIFSRSMGELQGAPKADMALQALAQGRPFEAELPLARGDGPPQWYSLSVRRAQAEGQQPEAVAVLTDITRLKKQQTELQQLLRDRELMFNLSEVGIVYQRGARIERANQAMAELTGWASTELSTLDAVELYANARECVEFEARIAQGLREHHRYSGERRLRRRDGSLLWVQVAVRPVTEDERPDAVGVICSFVDIDERRRARESLASQAERTRAILNSVLVGIVTVSERGIQWMNRSARRMFGGELADFVGEPLSIVATPELDHPLRRTDYLSSLQEGHAETFECRLKARDGREFWVVGNAVLTGDAARGAGSGELTIALMDIERRRQAEVSIAQAQASLQRVIETAPLAIALFEARSLRVQQLNHTAASFLGQPLEQVLGATLDEATAAPRAQALRAWLAQAAESGKAGQHEWRDEVETRADDNSDGHAMARVWDCRIAPLDDTDAPDSPHAPHAQLLLVASDVTEQRAAERARLQAAIDQREVLVREVHHRIKNNLQGVAGLLQQSVARHPDLSVVLSEAISQVQAIAQVYGLQVGASGPLEVASLLQAIAHSVQRTFGRPIAVAVEGLVPHLLPEAESIPMALTVNELLTNAIKHGQGLEGQAGVRCTLRADGETVQVRIASVARLPEGFDLTRVRAGVSGLSLVRALLPRRSATLTLAQEGEDVVAAIELRPPGVRLPLADETAALEAAQTETQAAGAVVPEAAA
jgi:PAS domain S-box-containing protein